MTFSYSKLTLELTLLKQYHCRTGEECEEIRLKRSLLLVCGVMGFGSSSLQLCTCSHSEQMADIAMVQLKHLSHHFML